MQMPTVDPLQIKRTSAPMTPRDETPFAGRPTAETKKIDLIFSKNDSDSVKQAPTFSELSEIESEDDDVPLATLARISPSPPPAVQGANKRGRASSPGPANMGRPNRRMVSQITYLVMVLEPCISGAPVLRMSAVKRLSRPKHPGRWDSVHLWPVSRFHFT